TGFVERLWERSPEAGSAVITTCLPVLAKIDRDQARALFTRAEPHLTPSKLAEARVFLEDWPGIEAALDAVEPSDLVRALLGVIDALGEVSETSAPRALLNKLTGLGERTPAQAKILIFGRLAQITADSNAGFARDCLRKAIGWHLLEGL